MKRATYIVRCEFLSHSKRIRQEVWLQSKVVVWSSFHFYVYSWAVPSKGLWYQCFLHIIIHDFPSSCL